jgi:hypothetical protein
MLLCHLHPLDGSDDISDSERNFHRQSTACLHPVSRDFPHVEGTEEDLVKNPASTNERVYEKLGWHIDNTVRERILTYSNNKPKGSRGEHSYLLGETGLVEGEGEGEGEGEESYRFYNGAV